LNRLSLRDVNAPAGDREVVGVVGANEASKATLCLVASGLAPRSIGGTLSQRLIDGHASADLPCGRGAGRHLLQNPYTQLSQVADTVFGVAFGAMNLGLDGSR
jgi:energy-coupling factor transporter ATP-binding protein EcfA2